MCADDPKTLRSVTTKNYYNINIINIKINKTIQGITYGKWENVVSRKRDRQAEPDKKRFVKNNVSKKSMTKGCQNTR